MSEYAPPTGPPPPKVPEGWKAVYNQEYKEWFYVNLHTKQSQWDKPTEPAPGNPETTSGGAPPAYASGPNDPQVSDTKKPLDSNNPYNTSGPNPGETDEQLARRLQEEETARASGHGPSAPGGQTGGDSASYYNQGPNQYQNQYPNQYQNQYSNQQQPYQSQYQNSGYDSSQNQGMAGTGDRSSGKSGGLLGKLASKLGGSSKPHGSGFGGGYPPQQQYGGYPQQGYYPQQRPYGMPMGGMGYGSRPPRKGMGAGGAAALGVGGGLVGGMLLADAINDGEQDAYQDGYADGYDQGDDGGGDFGGGDFGGGE